MHLINLFALAVGFVSSVASVPCNKCDCDTDTPLSAAPPTSPFQGQACPKLGHMECLGKDFGHCDYSGWAVTICPENTACVPNDFECVPIGAEWDRVYEQVNGPLSAPPQQTEVPKFSQNPLHGTQCPSVGAKECLGKDFGHCDYSGWVVYDCINDTACVPNDFECVPIGAEWDRVNEQVNGNKNETPLQAPASPCKHHHKEKCSCSSV